MEILFLLVGAVFGFLIAFLLNKSKGSEIVDTAVFDEKIIALEKEKLVLDTQLINAEKQIERLSGQSKETIDQLKAELDSERQKVSAAEARIAASIEKFRAQEENYNNLKGELENINKKYTTEFENIANKILDEKSQKFTDQNKTNLDAILNPLKEKIKDFESKVEKAYKTESEERITLKTEIKYLIDLNKQVSEEANNLAKALKGENKTQGNWGELILEKVLERSGLIKGEEYQLQYSTSNEEGKRIQPDAVINLPDNKHIIVDAKVSLVAYEAYVNANDESDKDKFIKEHLISVRNHVKQLSEKNYQSSPDFDTPDFVLLFIPIESSFSLAVQADQEMFNYAWDRKIVIVSPSTLLATLRTIASIWKMERQSKNAEEIARQGAALYDKFVGFIEDMDKIGKAINATQSSYDSAVKKLHTGAGNLVRRVEGLDKLGVKPTKQIPAKFLDDETFVEIEKKDDEDA